MLVVPQGGTLQLRDGEFVVSGADSAVVLVAIATSFKRFDDVSGDPEAITRAQIKAAAGKSFETLRAAHVADHQKLFRRVAFELPATPASEAADRRAHPQFADQRRSAARGAVFPVRALPAHRLLAARHAAREPAGHLERQADRRPGARKYTININTRDELLARRAGELAECVRAAGGDGEGPRGHGRAHGARALRRAAAGWRTTTRICGARPRRSTARSGACGRRAARGCASTCGITTTTARDARYLAEVYPLLQGRGAVLPRHAGRGSVAAGSWSRARRISPENNHPHGASICAGPAMDSQILRDLFANCIRAAEILGVDADFREACAAARAQASAGPHRQGRAAAGMAGGLGHGGAGARSSARLASVRAVPERADHAAPHAGAGGGRATSLELRGDLSTGWAIAWRINLWARLRDAEHAHWRHQTAAGSRRAPTPTCSTRTRRSRSTATSAAPTA